MEPATKRRKLSNEGIETVSEHKESTTEQDKRQSLFVRSIPASVTKEKLIEHFSQSYPLKHATIVLDPQTKVSRGFGFVTFTDAADAQAALAEFNNSLLEGRKIKVEPAEARHREVDENIDGKAHSKNTKGQELRAKREQQQEDNKPPKLIVRNLPWSIKTADDLAKLFLSYGKVKHAVVPKLPGEKGQAGFGIVIIRGKKNAERALEGVSGREIDGRTLAVDWAVDKETWQKVQQQGNEQEEATTEEAQVNGTVTLAADAADDASEDDADESGIALDNEKVGLEPADDTSSDGSDEEAADEEESEDEDDADLDEDDISGLAAPDTPASKSTYNTENTTVFLRNIPYDTTDESLTDHFQTHFGPTRYARVVYDHETERPRGTAFVCFRHEIDAKECVKNCPKQDAPDSRNHKSSAPSILQDTTLDPSGKYTLDGRLLHVTRALPKPEADRRATESASTRLAKQQSDKRRLYLLSEGTVSPGTTLYNQLSKTELDIRAGSAKQRQKLVKTNPNLGLSLTRLSIRNLPRWVDARALKALAREGIVGFASDVKEGRRAAISKEELARDGEIGRQAEAQRKAAGKGVVKQAKIVYESEMTGGKVAEWKGGRSRGYGFVEYWGHRSALMGLRWLNGHLVKRPKGEEAKGKDMDGDERGKRLIVEFAIENAQVVQRREEREKRDKWRRTKEAEGKDEEGKDEVPAKGKARDREFKGKRDNKDKGGRSLVKGRGQAQTQDHKRKRDSKDEGRVNGADKKQKKGPDTSKATERDAKDQDEKNKVAARNRIIAQKRQKRRNRKG
ncbi:RNA recognition motif-containing protein [Knufia obscura]|uniref:RNA recognition motif-containing protein n=1 Tax=Knufia obscura TaxID=1635080 RepID=A0ABR0S1S1_9EURO|nr:RNA recognition motif-containing protein [Knufia obscura]